MTKKSPKKKGSSKKRSSLMNILLSKKGFGLLEILALAGLGLVISMNLLKISQNSLYTSRVAESDLAEQDLEHSVIQILNNQQDCKWNLRPDNLSDTALGKGKLINNALVKTGDNNFATPPTTSDDITLIEEGDFRKALNVVKLEFIIPDSSVPSQRSLVVYYSKKNLSEYNTLDGVCSNSNTDGCFFKACLVEYSSSGSTVNNCNFIKCENQGVTEFINVSGISCAPNQLFKGFDDDGNKICEDISLCPVGQSLRGFNKDGTKNCVDIAKCADGQSFKGFDENGNKLCEPVLNLKLHTPCPTGQYITGIDSNGNTICKVVCTGKRSWNADDSACECPTGKQWNGLECVSSGET